MLTKTNTAEITMIATENTRVASRGNERCSQAPCPTTLRSQYHPVRKNVPAKANLFNQRAKTPNTTPSSGNHDTTNRAPEARANRAAFAPGS